MCHDCTRTLQPGVSALGWWEFTATLPCARQPNIACGIVLVAPPGLVTCISAPTRLTSFLAGNSWASATEHSTTPWPDFIGIFMHSIAGQFPHGHIWSWLPPICNSCSWARGDPFSCVWSARAGFSKCGTLMAMAMILLAIRYRTSFLRTSATRVSYAGCYLWCSSAFNWRPSPPFRCFMLFT